MDTNEEIELLKKSIIHLTDVLNNHENAIRQLEKVQGVINSDIHNRLCKIEKPENKNSAHYFYSKDENGCWLVKCAKTQGTFSTALWRNEVVQKQKCPCCGLTVRRKD